MPVKSEPKERPIIRMLLSACDNGAWRAADLNWVEEKQDGAVEVIATRADDTRLALEHTLIQPFVGEKFDSEVFMRAVGRIEKNPALTLPERHLDVIIPVNAIPKGHNWDDVGRDLLNWLLANHTAAPQEGSPRMSSPSPPRRSAAARVADHAAHYASAGHGRKLSDRPRPDARGT